MLTQLVGGRTVYPERPDLHKKPFYYCAPCQAWVGCHPGTTRPLGTAADYSLRKARQRAHRHFDPIWHSMTGFSRQGSGVARSAAYRWLANTIGVAPADCHIGMFTLDQCHRVIDACHEWQRARESVR